MKAGARFFAEELIDSIPMLREVLNEHLEDQGGELLPHPLLGDVSRWLVERFIRQGEEDVTVRGILAFMEEAFRNGDKQVQELLSVSFLENLPQSGQRGHEILSLLGPSLQLEQQNLE